MAPLTLVDAARRHAARYPGGLAVLDGTRRWTWAELDAAATAIATAVRDAGIGSGARVGLAIGPTALAVAALHGGPRTGRELVVIHPRSSPGEARALTTASGCELVLVDPAAGFAAPDGVRTFDLAEAARGGRHGTTGKVQVVAADVGAAELASGRSSFMVMTSGTTGGPRAARLTQAAVAASAAAWLAVLPEATAWLLSLGPTHVAGIGIVARAAAAGVPVVVPTDLDPPALLEALRSAADGGVPVSHLSVVATQLAGLLEASADEPPPPGLRAVLVGGGPAAAPLLRRAVSAGWPVVPTYGMTETASGVAALPTEEVAAHAETVGRALPGVELRISPDGRIAVRGPMLFTGDLPVGAPEPPAAEPPAPQPAPEPTAERHAPDTALDTAGGDRGAPDADGWYVTGDLGSLDAEGRLTVLGRADDVIISGGEKVAPAEVVAALLDHPDLVDAHVLGAPDPRWGTVPVALVALRHGADVSDQALRDHVRTRLAAWKVPARIVRVAAIPRGELGKVARADAARLLAADADRSPTDDTVRVTMDDGQPIAIRDLPGPAATPVAADGPDRVRPTVILLHATLSSAEQLGGLARRLAAHARVIALDRRGSGRSAMAASAAVPVERHAADVAAVIDHLGLGPVVLVGHSFGGVVALRTALLVPDRLTGLLVWEPPFLPLAEAPVRAGMTAMTEAVAAAHATDGPGAAARIFLEGVTGAGAWDRLQPRQREAIGRAGDGVLADVAMDGLTADRLEAIGAPTIVGTGGRSEPFYRPIADAIAARIGSAARRVDLPEGRHTTPITDPDAVVELVLDLLDRRDRTARTSQEPAR